MRDCAAVAFSYWIRMTTVHFAATMRALFWAVLFLAAPFAIADSWSYPAERTEKVHTFGETRIVLITDATQNHKYPDFIFQVFKNDQLQSQVHNVSFEQVFSNPGANLFVGLSNDGRPGTAVVVFNDRGAIGLLASHGIAEFDYCEKSISVQRVWYDAENPQVTFLAETKIPGAAGITLRDCRGRTVDLADVVLKAYNTSSTIIMRARGRVPKHRR
jgi:hypothetical protein